MLALVSKIADRLLQHQWYLATAESCTGGGVAAALTSLSGSSRWFDRGFVSYSNVSKEEMLGVKNSILQTYGAVSRETAAAMAEGALRYSHSQWSLSITGIAGPEGGTPEKPVGTVWFAWAQVDQAVETAHQLLIGDRAAIQQQSILYALEGLWVRLQK